MIVDFNDNGLKIGNLSSISAFSPNSCGIILLHYDKVPPHLGFVMHHLYYSITLKSVDILPFEHILKVIKKKKIPTLILETEALAINASELETVFQNEGLVNEQVSCLNPLTKIFSQTFNQTIQAEVIFDLIKVIVERQYLISAYSNAKVEELFILFYTKKMVEEYILKSSIQP